MIVFTGIWNENSSLLYPASHHLHTKRGVYPFIMQETAVGKGGRSFTLVRWL